MEVNVITELSIKQNQIVKQCSKCGVEKSVDFFSKTKSTKDGLYSLVRNVRLYITRKIKINIYYRDVVIGLLIKTG